MKVKTTSYLLQISLLRIQGSDNKSLESVGHRTYGTKHCLTVYKQLSHEEDGQPWGSTHQALQQGNLAESDWCANVDQT